MGAGCLGALADDDTGHVGDAVPVALTGADTDGVGPQRRQVLARPGQGDDQCHAGGRRQFPGTTRGESPAAGQFQYGGHGYRQVAVGGGDAARAHRYLTGGDGGHAQGSQARTHTDDVRNGIKGADLVEVDVVHRPAVDAGFGVGKPGEDAHRPGANGGRQGTVPEQVADDRPRPVRRVVDQHLDVDLGRPQPRASDCGAVQPDGPRHHGVDRVLNKIERRAGVDQCTEQHVPGHAGGGIDPRVRSGRIGVVGHGAPRSGSAIWAARYPAP